jgi:Bacterial DNA-binding protein
VLPGFGKLVKQKRTGRTGINPKTLEKIKIPAKQSLSSESRRRQRMPFWESRSSLTHRAVSGLPLNDLAPGKSDRGRKTR